MHIDGHVPARKQTSDGTDKRDGPFVNPISVPAMAYEPGDWGKPCAKLAQALRYAVLQRIAVACTGGWLAPIELAIAAHPMAKC